MLNGVPRLVVDDSQAIDDTGLPLVFWSPAVNASPSFGMFSPLSAIEVELANILRILQHEINRVAPPKTARILEVQPLRDRFLAESIGADLNGRADGSCLTA